MRIGIILTDITAADALWCARRAESYGVESVWVPEMIRRDSISILGAIAATTQRIKVATSIINVYSRTPALIAMTLATLQELSNDRLIFGMSTGNPAYIGAIHGMEFKSSITRMREVIEVLRKLSRDEKIDEYRGKTFKLSGWEPRFDHLNPLFPIFVGAHGPNMLKFAGEEADGVILNLVDVDGLRRAATIVNDVASARGRARKPAVASLLMVSVDPDPRKAEARVRKQIAYYLIKSKAIRHRLMGVPKFAGDVEKIERDGRGQNTKLDHAAESLSEEIVDSLSVHGSDLKGFEERLSEYKKAGLTLPICYVAGWLGDSRTFVEEQIGKIAAYSSSVFP